MNYPSLVQQLDSLQVLPKPERFTELYFTDHTNLPAAIRVSVPQKIVFSTHNMEHQQTTYTYKIIVASSKDEQILQSDNFTLQHDETHVTEISQAIPPLDKRVVIKVVLEYGGLLFGDTQPHMQMQSIHYAVDVVGIVAEAR